MAATGSRRTAAMGILFGSYAQAGLVLVKGFLFIPLYLRHFDLATYGGYLASSNVVGLLGVLDVGITTAIYQSLAFAHGRGERERFARLAGAGGTVLGIAALMIITIGWGIARFVPGWINSPLESVGPLAQTFRLTVVGAAAMILNQGILGIPAAWQLSRIIAASRVGAQVVEMLVVVLALFSKWGVVSLGLGSLAGGLFGLGITLYFVARQWHLRKLPSPRPDRASLGWLFSVGVPTMLSRVAGQIAANLEVALVSVFLGPSAAAVYGITERTFRLAQGFINPIVGAAFSGLAHFMGERGPAALMTPLRELRGLYVLVVSVVLPSILIVNRDFVTLWVGPEKFGGTLLSAALALSTGTCTQVSFVSLVASATGQLRRVAYLGIVEAVVRLPLMFVGLRFLGPVGLPLAASLGYSFLAILAYPAVIGTGLGLTRAAARGVVNAGLNVLLVTIALGGLSARYLPVATRWPTLALKGGTVALTLLGITMLLNQAARVQMQALAAKAFHQPRRRP